MQLGTLSGNPIAAVAGLKTLEILRRDGMYQRLRHIGQDIMEMAADALNDAGVPHQIVGDQTLFDVVFSETPVRNYRDVVASDYEKNAKFNAVLRAKGLLKPLGKIYPSLALSDGDMNQIEEAMRAGARAL